MISDMINLAKRIALMSSDEQKKRLVEMRKNQIIRQKLINDDSLLMNEEMEAMMILQCHFPIDDPTKSVKETIDGIIAFRNEINELAEKELAV